MCFSESKSTLPFNTIRPSSGVSIPAIHLSVMLLPLPEAPRMPMTPPSVLSDTSSEKPENLFSDALPLTLYSRGMGALGLPGDLSSASRFVRAAFTRLHSVSGEGEADSVGQFFHILGAVEQQNGCCEVRPGEYERTIYTSCWNADRGIYYYTTYTNRRISAVELRREDLDAAALIRYPMRTREDIFYQNAPGTES